MINKKVALLVVVGVIAGLLVTGALVMQRGGDNQVAITPTPSFIEPTEEPLPTAEEEVDISTFKVKVLNGTATAGLAAKVQTQLTDAGFTVSSIGNADKKDYQSVILQVKSTVSASVIEKIKETLSTYTFGTQGELDETDEDDVVIILGAKTAATTPTTKPSSPTGQTNPTTTQVTVTPTPTTAQ